MKSIIIVGASQDRRKYSNKAIRAYVKKGWTVFPVSPRYTEVEGVRCYKRISEVPDGVHLVSLYVRPEVGISLLDEMVKHEIERVVLNPGADSQELIVLLKEKGITPLLVCSILSIGEDPTDY